ACKDRVSFTLRRKPAGRGRRDRPVIGRGQLTPKNDAVCPPFKRQEPRYLTSDPHRDPDGRFQKSGKGGLGSRATASKIPVILAVLDGNLVCSYNVYYWHIFNNHPNYGCKSLEYSQNFRSITVSGLPCLMKNPHFDAVALIETALRISRLSHPGHGTRCTGWWLRHRSRRFSAAHPQTRNPQG